MHRVKTFWECCCAVVPGRAHLGANPESMLLQCLPSDGFRAHRLEMPGTTEERSYALTAKPSATGRKFAKSQPRPGAASSKALV